MLRFLSFLLAAIRLAQTILDLIRERRVREEGQEDVRRQQEKVNEAAKERALEIDAGVRDAELDALRERMRDYQRTTP